MVEQLEKKENQIKESASVFYNLALSFIFGVFIGTFVEVDVYLLLAVCLSIVCSFLVSLFIFKRNNIHLCLSIILFLSGILRVSGFHELPIRVPLDKKVSLQAQIIDEPDFRENRTLIKIKVLDEKKSDVILVTLPPNERYLYGDVVSVLGTVKLPQVFETYKDHYFPYREYLMKDGICCVSYYPKINLVSRGGGNIVMKKLLDLKGSFINSLGVSIVEPESTLASGLLLGAKNSLPKSVSDDLRNAGIIHIVVLSGYNITIVADSLMKVLGFLPRIISFSFGIISVLLFALMTGASATVVRASIMSLVLILARFSNRDYLAMRALVLAGFVMVVHNPSILVFDFSFQLSFLASIGLVLLSGRFSSHLKFVTNRFSIREIVSSTLSTQVFVLPFLIYSTGKLSLWGFLSNVLVLPIIPLTMFLSLISGLVGYVGGIFSYIIGGVAYLFLKYIFVIASFFGNLDFGIFDITNISFKTLVIFYLILLFFIFFKRK